MLRPLAPRLPVHQQPALRVADRGHHGWIDDDFGLSESRDSELRRREEEIEQEVAAGGQGRAPGRAASHGTRMERNRWSLAAVHGDWADVLLQCVSLRGHSSAGQRNLIP